MNDNFVPYAYNRSSFHGFGFKFNCSIDIFFGEILGCSTLFYVTEFRSKILPFCSIRSSLFVVLQYLLLNKNEKNMFVLLKNFPF